jgi:hypothetical protein
MELEPRLEQVCSHQQDSLQPNTHRNHPDQQALLLSLVALRPCVRAKHGTTLGNQIFIGADVVPVILVLRKEKVYGQEKSISFETVSWKDFY